MRCRVILGVLMIGQLIKALWHEYKEENIQKASYDMLWGLMYLMLVICINLPAVG